MPKLNNHDTIVKYNYKISVIGGNNNNILKTMSKYNGLTIRSLVLSLQLNFNNSVSLDVDFLCCIVIRVIPFT